MCFVVVVVAVLSLLATLESPSLFLRLSVTRNQICFKLCMPSHHGLAHKHTQSHSACAGPPTQPPTVLHTHTLGRTWWTGALAQSVPLDGLHSMIHTVIYSCESHSIYTQPNNAVITSELQEWKKKKKRDSNVWNRGTEKISLAHSYLQIMLCFNFRSYYVVFGLDPLFEPDASWCV